MTAAVVRTHQSSGHRTEATQVRHAIKKIAASKNGKLPTDGVVPMVITPELAGDWLARNSANRKVRDFRAVKLAHEIKAGRWFPLNGETIKFSVDGELLDGQHRLLACIIADTPIETYVAFGVAPNAFKSIDTGLKRSVRDALYVSGEVNGSTELAATVNAMYRWLSTRSFLFGAAPSIEESLNVLAVAPGLRESTEVAKRLRKRVPGATLGVMACIHYLTNEIDPDECAFFFGRLLDGTGLAADDPIYFLRERLMRSAAPAGSGFRLQQEVAVIAAKAWNAFRQDKKFNARSLRFWPDEAMPELV